MVFGSGLWLWPSLTGCMAKCIRSTKICEDCSIRSRSFWATPSPRAGAIAVESPISPCYRAIEPHSDPQILCSSYHERASAKLRHIDSVEITSTQLKSQASIILAKFISHIHLHNECFSELFRELCRHRIVFFSPKLKLWSNLFSNFDSIFSRCLISILRK